MAKRAIPLPIVIHRTICADLQARKVARFLLLISKSPLTASASLPFKQTFRCCPIRSTITNATLLTRLGPRLFFDGSVNAVPGATTERLELTGGAEALPIACEWLLLGWIAYQDARESTLLAGLRSAGIAQTRKASPATFSGGLEEAFGACAETTAVVGAAAT